MKNFARVRRFCLLFLMMVCGSLISGCAHRYYNTGPSFVRLPGEFMGHIDGGIFTAYPQRYNQMLFFAYKYDLASGGSPFTPRVLSFDLSSQKFRSFETPFEVHAIKPSPQNSLWAFIAGDNRRILSIMDVQNRKLEKIYESSFPLFFPHQDYADPWSPSGTDLIFLEKNSDDHQSVLYGYNLNQRALTVLVKGKNAKFCYWLAASKIALPEFIEHDGDVTYQLRQKNIQPGPDKILYKHQDSLNDAFEFPLIHKIFIQERQSGVVMVDSTTWQPQPFPLLDYLPGFWSVTSPDRKFILTLKKDKQSVTMMDLVKLEEKILFYHPAYSNLGNLVISPAGNIFAFTGIKIGKDKDPILGTIFMGDFQSREVIPFVDVPAQSAISIPPIDGSLIQFSPDGQQLVYMVANEEAQKSYLDFYSIPVQEYQRIKSARR